MLAESIAEISGSANGAPTGISSKHAVGLLGGVGGKPTPFAFNNVSICFTSCCPPSIASFSNSVGLHPLHDLAVFDNRQSPL